MEEDANRGAPVGSTPSFVVIEASRTRLSKLGIDPTSQCSLNRNGAENTCFRMSQRMTYIHRSKVETTRGLQTKNLGRTRLQHIKMYQDLDNWIRRMYGGYVQPALLTLTCCLSWLTSATLAPYHLNVSIQKASTLRCFLISDQSRLAAPAALDSYSNG